MRRFALYGLVFGAVVLGAFVFGSLQGRPVAGPILVLLALGAGILAVSIRILLPSYPLAVERRLAKVELMDEDKRGAYLGRLFRKQLVVVVVALPIEIAVAALYWPFVEWRPWIVAAIGTTVLMSVLLVALMIRHRKSSRQGSHRIDPTHR